MIPEHRQRLLVAITSMAEVFNRGLSDASLELVAAVLCDWPIEAIEGAMVPLLRECRWMPSAAEWGDYADAWVREEISRRRQERLATHALPEEAESLLGSPEEQAARAKQAIDDLAKKMGWR